MRLGGPVGLARDPQEWVDRHRALGYRAAYCPLQAGAEDDLVAAYRKAAEEADLLISEVGAWSNPMSPDAATRSAALEKCKASLDLAERIGARCCVNIAGSCGEQWDGPHPENLTETAFAAIVETVREIIDAVQPKRTCYTLETMPWMYPDSPESYERLIRAIGRTAFGVHLDPVNLVNCPERYYQNANLIRECFRRLGPHIQSCHAKDITLSGKLMVHLDEVRPGMGHLDYRVFLEETSRLGPNFPIMLEHLPNDEEYRLAAEHIRGVAESVGVIFG